MPELAVARSGSSVLKNAKANQPLVKRTIAELRGQHREASAIVISGGPSLHRNNPIAKILASGYRGVILTVDGALGACLRQGLVPNYVLTLDPHGARVVRWFGDPGLDERPPDDYFQRQELDPHLGVKERERNREMVELVNRHGPKIRVAAATSVYPEVPPRCVSAGMSLYWWNPIVDDPDRASGLTRQLYQLNHAPCMVSGGNVGSAAWIFAHSVLGIKHVAVVGMDFGYAPDIPLEKTQYYTELKALFGDRAQDAVVSVYNPHTKETWYSDPAYYWYRQGFLDMVTQADCVTYNCTEGGTLFGKGVNWMPLQEFLRDQHAAKE